jgi:nocturnin
VDHFDQFEEALGARAYCFFAGKGDRDGCALFVPKKRFAMLGEPEKVLLEKKMSQVALIVRIKDLTSNRHVTVACTHLKAKYGFEEVRQRQAKAVCDAVARIKQPGDIVLIGGDFNDEPNSLACEEMRRHGYQSAYAALKIESYSTSKIRESLSERCIDYIWFDPKVVQPAHALGIPPAESLGPTKLPLPGFPSDHLSIAAVFDLK